MKKGKFYRRKSGGRFELCVEAVPKSEGDPGIVTMNDSEGSPESFTPDLFSNAFEIDHPLGAVRIRAWNQEKIDALIQDLDLLGIDSEPLRKFDLREAVYVFLEQMPSGNWTVSEISEFPEGRRIFDRGEVILQIHETEEGEKEWRDLQALLQESVRIYQAETFGDGEVVLE